MKQRNPVAHHAQRSGAGKHKDKLQPMPVQMHEAPEPVCIDWHDDDDYWRHFWLLEMRCEWVKLQGRDALDGSAHEGDVFWVHQSEIELMEVDL